MKLKGGNGKCKIPGDDWAVKNMERKGEWENTRVIRFKQERGWGYREKHEVEEES